MTIPDTCLDEFQSSLGEGGEDADDEDNIAYGNVVVSLYVRVCVCVCVCVRACVRVQMCVCMAVEKEGDFVYDFIHTVTVRMNSVQNREL